MKQITYRDLEPRREELGLTLQEMTRKCGLEEWRFLEMIERGEIETTSSVIMAHIAKGYEFELEQCVGMIVHWSPSWPREKFKGKVKKARKQRERRKLPKGKQIEYHPGALREMMEKQGISYEQLRKAVSAKINYYSLRDIMSGLRETLTPLQMETICTALRCRPEDIAQECGEGGGADERVTKNTGNRKGDTGDPARDACGARKDDEGDAGGGNT